MTERASAPTILIADDDMALRALVRVTLTAQGWNVIEAANPHQCVDLARQHRPEVLLLDVTFEGHSRDGYAVCRELTTASDTKAIRVVLFTARDDPERRAFASAVGATAFIVKPFGPLDLVRMLRLIREQPAGEPGIGLYLVEAGVIRPAQLEKAIGEQRLRQGERVPLGKILVELGYATLEDVRAALDRQHRLRPLPPVAPRSRDRLRVLIADDNASVREGLRELITSQDDFVLVGAAADGAEALRLVRETRPDLVVLDNDMPRLSGIDVLRQVNRSMPDTTVVIFTLDDEVRGIALAEGAAAVVMKDVPLDHLLTELRTTGRRARPEDHSSSVVLTARKVSPTSWVSDARRRRALVTVGALQAGYALAFLIAEPTLGASASVLAIPFVAAAGMLIGPEAGLIAGFLSSVVTAALWQTTNHPIGEPILRVGGNGLGILALMGIGAGFGAMRLVRGRLDPHGRRVSALAESALALAPGLTPASLELLAEAALEIVPGDVALLYEPVPEGGLELVAASGAAEGAIGTRRVAGAVAEAHSTGRSAVVADLALTPIGVDVPHAHSAVVVPVVGVGDAPGGVIAVVSMRKGAYSESHLAALASYASFLSSLLNAPPTTVAVSDRIALRVAEESR